MKYRFLIFLAGFVFSLLPIAKAETSDQVEVHVLPDDVMVSDPGSWRFVNQPQTSKSKPGSRNKGGKASQSKRKSARNKKPSGKNNSNSNSNSQTPEPSSDAAKRCDSFANKESCQPFQQWDTLLCKCVDSNSVQSEPGNQDSNRSGRTAAMDAVIRKCSHDLDVARSDCDQEQDAGIQGAQTTLTNFALGTGTQMGIAGACSGYAKYVAGANAAVIYFAQNCSSSRSNCMTSCQRARAQVQDASGETQAEVAEYLTSCKDLDTKIAEGTQAIKNVLDTLQGAKSCKKDTDPAFASYCASNPTAIGCATTNLAMDCSNPSIAATNSICICKNNPGSASCTGALAKVSNNGGGYDPASMTSTLGKGGAGVGSPDSDNLMGDANWAGDPNLKADRGASEEAGGNKGGRPLMDGGAAGNSGSGDKGKGGGEPAQGIAVNAGFHGGGGGGGGWGGGNGGDEEGGSGVPGANEAGAKGPNLRDFLPGGGRDPRTVNRGLAGISGPDGITGPHSDIWKKVQNRYQIQVEKATLMP